MFGQLLALEMVNAAIGEALRLGASHADARFEIQQREDVVLENGVLRRATLRVERGLGLRVIVNGAFGFAAISQPTRHDAVVLARRAVELGRAAAIFREQPVVLASEPAHTAQYRTPVERDPLGVPLEDKVDLLLKVDQRLRKNPKICLSRQTFSAQRTRRLFLSSEGAEIDQDLTWTQVGYQAGAARGGELVVRSFPAGGGAMGRGFEVVEALSLLDRAEEIAEEAVEVLEADPCPAERTDVVLSPALVSAVALETIGRAAELDRALAGTSSLTPDKLGNLAVGSPLLDVYADATHEGAVGTFGYDDEGVEAQRVDLLVEGRFAGFLSSRDAARRVGLLRASGSSRAESWASPPLVRVSNLFVAPGRGGSLDELIADTKRGVLLAGHRGTTARPGDGFRTDCEVAIEIRDGRLGRRLHRPSFEGRVSSFFGACDAVGGPDSWELHGWVAAEKGHPTQRLPVGLGAPPCRVRQVEIGAAPGAPSRLPSDAGLPYLDHPGLSPAVEALAAPSARRAKAKRSEGRRRSPKKPKGKK